MSNLVEHSRQADFWWDQLLIIEDRVDRLRRLRDTQLFLGVKTDQFLRSWRKLQRAVDLISEAKEELLSDV